VLQGPSTCLFIEREGAEHERLLSRDLDVPQPPFADTQAPVLRWPTAAAGPRAAAAVLCGCRQHAVPRQLYEAELRPVAEGVGRDGATGDVEPPQAAAEARRPPRRGPAPFAALAGAGTARPALFPTPLFPTETGPSGSRAARRRRSCRAAHRGRHRLG
jgi:hypothetical protein